MTTSIAKFLASRLHPPLIVTPRDSQRLLIHLNESFKRQLDRVHSAKSSSTEHYTDIHLKAILTNPLFDAKPRMRATSSDKKRYDQKPLGMLRSYIERPMDAFKERISQGTADLRIAKFFMGIQLRACLASAAATPREAMQTSGVVSTILSWLWSSGLEDAGKFLQDKEFLVLLVPFLVAEGQHARILRWLYRCHDPSETSFSSLNGSSPNRLQSFLFATLIKEEIRTGDGLSSAITLFHRTVNSPRSSWATTKSVQNNTTSAAWVLTSTILHLPEAVEPEPSNFQHFLETVRNSVTDPLLSATLCAYSPKRADPQPALRYLKMLSAKTFVTSNAWRRSRIVLLALRAAGIFLQDGRQTEALWIMTFLQTKFAREVGLSLPYDPKTSISDEPMKISRREMNFLPSLNTLTEEESLLLLDTLAIH